MFGLGCTLACTAQPSSGTPFGNMQDSAAPTTGMPDASTTAGPTGSGSESSTTAAADSTGPGTSSEDSSAGDSTESSTGGCAKPLQVFADADEDGFGDPEMAMETCEGVAGFVEDNTDCDDTLDTVNPGAPELCDGIDNNCNGVLDEFSLENAACDACTLTARGVSVYWFCEGPVNRFAGREFCLDRGADLTSITDLPEDSFVRDNVAGPRDWFIGLEDLAQEGDYVWSDGSDATYFAWAFGEPNNVDNENCVELALEDDWAWNDTNCENEQAFVCEATIGLSAKR